MRDIRLSRWRTEHGRQEYLEAYDAAMALWPVPFESRFVPTRFGMTHVIVSGEPDREPLLLLHAATGFSATQWYPNVAGLSEEFCVYAVDFIGAPGKGNQTKPIVNALDCARWLDDLLDALAVDQAFLAGSSQGGWLALNFALNSPSRVSALALLAPAAAIYPMTRLMRAFIRMGPRLPAWAGPLSIKALFAGRAEVDERILRMLTLHLRHFRYQDHAVFPTVFEDEALRGLSTRTLVLIAEHEQIYDPHSALERAQRLIPDVQAELVAGVGHLINMEAPDLATDWLLRFAGTAR